VTVFSASDVQSPRPWYFADRRTQIPQLTFFGHSDPSSTSALVQEWQGELKFVFHRDHGYADGWVEPRFGTATLAQVQGTLSPAPIVFSMNCETGRYDKEDGERCFAEALMRSPRGATAVVAASRASWTQFNDRFVEKLIQAMWPSFELEFDLPALPLSARLGSVLSSARSQMLHSQVLEWGQYRKYTAEVFNLFGDPELAVRPTPEEPRGERDVARVEFDEALGTYLMHFEGRSRGPKEPAEAVVRFVEIPNTFESSYR
jgi:hypothetical protein